jgi:hypothetical protein
MAEQPSPQGEKNKSRIKTDGGAYIDGDVSVGGDFAGRDLYKNAKIRVKQINNYVINLASLFGRQENSTDPDRIKRQNLHFLTIASLLVLVLLFAAILLVFYIYPQIRYDRATSRLHESGDSVNQIREMANVANLIGKWPLGNRPAQYLAVYFDHVEPAKKVELFQQADSAVDLHHVISVVYALPNVDSEHDNRSILEAMHTWLVKAEPSPSPLQKELSYWLEGQDLAKQEQIFPAVQKYNQAVAENSHNPAVLLERAQLYLKLNQYNQALQDGETALVAAYGLFPQQPPPASTTDSQQHKSTYIPILQRFENAFQSILNNNGKMQAYLRLKGETSYPHLFPLLPSGTNGGAAFEIDLNWTGSDDLDLWVQLEDDTRIDTGHPQGPNGGRLVNDANPGCLASSTTGKAQEVIAWYGAEVPANYVIGVSVAQTCGGEGQPGGIPFEIEIKNDGVVSTSYTGSILPEQKELAVTRIGNFKPEEQTVLSTGDQAVPVLGVTFSQDGRFLLIAAKDISIYAWQENTQPLYTIDPTCNLNSYAISPDWSSLALACDDGAIEIWDVEGQRHIQTLKPERNDIVQVAISGQGEYLAYAGSNGDITVMDMLSGEIYPALTGQQYPVSKLLFTPDREYLFSAAKDQTIYRWKIDSDQHVITGGFFTRTLTAPIFLESDPLTGFLVDGDETGAFSWWDENTGAVHHTIETNSNMVQMIAFSAERQVAALITGMPEQARNIYLTDLQTGQMISEIENRRGPVRALAFPPGGDYLAVGFDNGEVVLWETRLGIIKK